jgi:hypothetical protein
MRYVVLTYVLRHARTFARVFLLRSTHPLQPQTSTLLARGEEYNVGESTSNSLRRAMSRAQVSSLVQPAVDLRGVRHRAREQLCTLKVVLSVVRVRCA